MRRLLQAARPHAARSTRSRTTTSSCATRSARWSRSSSTSPRTPPHGQFTAAQFRDRLDNGRKVAIQILEFFDRHGVTLRRGDLRRINRHRLDLFRRAARTAPRPRRATGGEASPVGRPDFKSGRGRETVLGGFDSHSLPPPSRSAAMTAACLPRRRCKPPRTTPSRRGGVPPRGGRAHRRARTGARLRLPAAEPDARDRRGGRRRRRRGRGGRACDARRCAPELGWTSDSEARAAVVARFAPVAEAVCPCAVIGCGSAGEPGRCAARRCAAFEAWYAETHAKPFWALFEHYIPETPLVDF